MDIDHQQPPAEPRQQTFGFLGWFVILIGIFLAIFRAWIWSWGTFDPEVFGYALSGVLLPGLIAYAISGRKKVRNPRRFALIFGSLCLFFFLTGSINRQMNPQNRIVGLMKEAAGTKPIDHSGGPGNVNDPVRDIFHDILEWRKSYEAEIAGFEPGLRAICSPPSFANKMAMRQSIDVVRGALAADQEFSRKLQALPEQFEKRIQQSFLSDSDKRGVMQGFNQAFAGSDLLAVRRLAIEAETDWANATVDLYDFALMNAEKIKVNGSKIEIVGGATTLQFNKKFTNSLELKKRLRALNSRLDQLQKASMQQIGLTTKDIEINSDPQPVSH